MKTRLPIILITLLSPLAGCCTAPDYALDAEVQNQRAKEAQAVNDMKGAFIKPTMASPEADAGRIRTAQ